jgi:hypothetical protein
MILRVNMQIVLVSHAIAAAAPDALFSAIQSLVAEIPPRGDLPLGECPRIAPGAMHAIE